MSSYVVASKEERQAMLEAMGKTSLMDLFSHLPKEVLLGRPLDLPAGKSEFEVAAIMEVIAEKNTVYKTMFRGAGAYRHYIPTIVNHLGSRSEYVTAYTPYQAEMSQGLLQTIFEYQTMIAQLTGMFASNASVYDGATAAAEAMSMCIERKRNRILISDTINPAVKQVMTTYCSSFEYPYTIIPAKDGVTDFEAFAALLDESVAGVYLEQLNYEGQVEDISKFSRLAHEHKVKVIMGCNPIAMALLPSAGECEADIAVGEGQPLGIPLSFGGPYLGFMAASEQMYRRLPGRIVGETTDNAGRRAFVLTLQAREQHIRREKATSSICSNQSLCAVRASMYLTTVGPQGLKDVAQRCVDNAHYLSDQLTSIPGVALKHNGEFFHEFVTTSQCPSNTILEELEKYGILGGLALSETEILWCATEVNTQSEMDTVVRIVKEVASC